jgi:hypothetical protein
MDGVCVINAEPLRVVAQTQAETSRRRIRKNLVAAHDPTVCDCVVEDDEEKPPFRFGSGEQR